MQQQEIVANNGRDILVETAIIKERNEELEQIERDIQDISECMTSIS